MAFVVPSLAWISASTCSRVQPGLRPAPTVLKDEDEDGDWVDYSYINHYLCNGGVVLCAFDDPHDEVAAGIFRGLFPERTVTLVDARTIFAGGGGIHCITQQQPKI